MLNHYENIYKILAAYTVLYKFLKFEWLSLCKYARYFNMKLIKLTQGKFAQVDDSDYDFLNQWKWYAQKSDRDSTFYAKRNKQIGKKRKTECMHRLILGIEDSKILGDHKDGNGLNNQRSNLRIVNKYQNARNRTSVKNSSSKYLGVTFHKNRRVKYITKDGTIKESISKEGWNAIIRIDGKNKHLGSFKNETEAAIVYNKVASKLFGEFANLNKI